MKKVNAKFNILLLIFIISPISFFPQKSSNIEQLGRFKSTNREKVRLWSLSRSSNKRYIDISKNTYLLNATFDPAIYSRPITIQIIDIRNNIQYNSQFNTNEHPEWEVDISHLANGRYSIVFYCPSLGRYIGFFDKTDETTKDYTALSTYNQINIKITPTL